MICTFTGQLTGTAVGNHVYAMGGWVRSGSVSVGFLGAALGICFLRGPREKGWIGWGGGWKLRKEGANNRVEDMEVGFKEEKEKNEKAEVGVGEQGQEREVESKEKSSAG